jgi:hypothetical protein
VVEIGLYPFLFNPLAGTIQEYGGNRQDGKEDHEPVHRLGDFHSGGDQPLKSEAADELKE